MVRAEPETEELIDQASKGDRRAADELLDRHRQRLKKTITVRMDSRLAGRVDPSDIVQETLLQAARKLPDYLERRPLPFYPWLRQLALERLMHLHQRHVKAQRRSVRREALPAAGLPDESVLELAVRLVATGTGPSERLLRRELQDRVRQALDELGPRDREVLVLRYMEQLSTADTAAVLGIGESAVKMRHLRALQRMRDLLQDE